MEYVWIGVAGIVGTWLRYGLGLYFHPWVVSTGFPWGTLAINWLGCFTLGWFSQWALGKSRISPPVRTSISTGLLGSFTTFSTLSVETMQLFRQGLYGCALAYVGMSLLGGLGLVWLGTALAGKQRRDTGHD